jgi:hypothetical protein
LPPFSNRSIFNFFFAPCNKLFDTFSLDVTFHQNVFDSHSVIAEEYKFIKIHRHCTWVHNHSILIYSVNISSPSLVHNTNAQVLVMLSAQLLESDQCGQSSGATTNNEHIKWRGFSWSIQFQGGEGSMCMRESLQYLTWGAKGEKMQHHHHVVCVCAHRVWTLHCRPRLLVSCHCMWTASWLGA